MRETPGQMAGNCLATAVIGFILFCLLGLPLLDGCVSGLEKVGNFVEGSE
jgi:hypothetical protein